MTQVNTKTGKIVFFGTVICFLSAITLVITHEFFAEELNVIIEISRVFFGLTFLLIIALWFYSLNKVLKSWSRRSTMDNFLILLGMFVFNWIAAIIVYFKLPVKVVIDDNP